MMAVSINVNVKMPDLGSTNVTKGIKNVCLNIRISENILCTLILLLKLICIYPLMLWVIPLKQIVTSCRHYYY